MTTEMATTNGSDKGVSYVPFGESKEIELSIDMVRRYFATPTSKGNVADSQEIIKFMMMCKARELNPWVGDAFLTGYDTNDGPKFTLITAHQALLKRAEVNPQFDGIESGVLVLDEKGKLAHRDGDFFLPSDETLVGAWAKCYRKDRDKPFSDTLSLSVYHTHRSRWNKDPGGMIVKCAEGSVLRTAFPSQIGGLYHAAEMGSVVNGEIVAPKLPPKVTESRISDVPDEMPEPASEASADDVDEALAATLSAEPDESIVAHDEALAPSAAEFPDQVEPKAGDGQLFDTAGNAQEL